MKRKIGLVIIISFSILIIFFLFFQKKTSESEITTNQYYYFAYGSNMDIDKMRSRTNNSNIKVIGPAYLENYHLTFPRKVGNIEKIEDQILWGCLYLLDMDDIYDLDRIEGYQEGREVNSYNRQTINVKISDQESYDAYIYIQPQSGDDITTLGYKNTLIRGALDCNLPKEYINLLENIKTN
jgi:gamma-glutamylcyclotransferase (GGCT)/AIG2-like uncharacterized protein YtfP